jgi:large conductance mechanosensitive channel
MGLIKEFKEFAMKGNVIDLAVGVIIGGAFGAIVKSLIDDVITPLLLNPALEASGAKNIQDLTFGAVKYGSFLSAVISFIMIAIVLFAIIKGVNASKKKEIEVPAAPAPPPAEQVLLAEIRDILKEKK